MKIVWAVDPFDSRESILSAAARAIRSLVAGRKAEVMPVYIWSRNSIGFAKPSPGFVKDLQERGQEELESAISKIQLKTVTPLEVHAVPYSSRREEARELVELARKAGADLIVVSSHGKRGLKRALLGSFAETLSLISDLPLFVVRPDSRLLPVRTILFPTDFSKESVEAFKKVVAFAKDRKSRITIFHKIVMAPYPVLDLPLSSAHAYGEFFTQEAREMAEEGKRLALLAADQGVRAQVVVDRSSPGTVSETIVRRARKANALIALCSRSGPIAGLLLGSTTRQVLREADVPVWVIHPGERKATALKPAFEVSSTDVERDLYERPA